MKSPLSISHYLAELTRKQKQKNYSIILPMYLELLVPAYGYI